MKNKPFADYETSKMLKELGFDLGITDFSKAYDKNGNEVNWTTKHFYCWKPIWQQVKEWLWEEHWIAFECFYDKEMRKFICGGWKLDNELTTFKTQSKSPIESETKAIQQTIKYLHKQLINKK